MSKLWKPDNVGKVIPVVRVRPLLPPPPQAGVRVQPQHLHWQLGHYVEDLSFGPGGRGKRRRWVVDQEAEQHNVVLSQTYSTLIGQYGFVALNDYAAVGTGSTPPSSAQTGLANEVSRTRRDENNSTAGTRTITRISDGVYNISVVREFLESEVGNRNLTEWGFSPASTAGNNLMSRELFRDGNGNPIVITPSADQRLRLIYAIRVTLTPVGSAPMDASIDISGLGTFLGKAFLTRYNEYNSPNGDLLLVDEWAKRSTVNLTRVRLSSYVAPSYNAQVIPYGPMPGKRLDQLSHFVPITNGMQIAQTIWTSAEENATWYGMAIVRHTSYEQRGSFALAFNSGVSFTKSNLYRLTIGPWTLTWGP